MTEEDLQELTGKKRWSAQARWLRNSFQIEPLRRGDGRVMITWETYRAMEAQRAGVGAYSAAAPASVGRPALRKVTFAGRAA
ncbi:DUF4224 domain-containing protein (plasmid) [Ralstonia syzygii subsp. celebesensis]|uniref:DUF4224 domain-containing protein n=1 Tax=Ralstonia syzygii TaxID=28097 RepID=UPI00387E0EAC